MVEDNQAFYAYYQDGTVEQFSNTGKLLNRYIV